MWLAIDRTDYSTAYTKADSNVKGARRLIQNPDSLYQEQKRKMLRLKEEVRYTCHMTNHCPQLARVLLGWGAVVLVGSISGCMEAVPQDAVEAVEHIDQDLMELRAAEFSPADYTQFAQQWMDLKARVQADEDLIRWLWEPNELEGDLRRLEAEGAQLVARLTEERESLRHLAQDKIAQVENRFQMVTLQVSATDGRFLSRQNPDEIERFMKQARAFYEQGRYDRSLDASNHAAQSLALQSGVLNSEVGRHAD